MFKRRYIKNTIVRGRVYAVRRAFTIFLCAIIAITLILHFAISRNIKEAISYKARTIATELISKKAYDILNRFNSSYDDIVTIDKDSSDNITAVQTDVMYINKLKAALTAEITDELSNFSQYPYKISLGTLLGSEYLSGHGPQITMRVEPVGYLRTDIISKFSSAGINQTQHQIILELCIEINTFIPIYSAKQQITTNYIIAETIIVGEVPKYYTSVISDDRSLISDLNDYEIEKHSISEG